MSDRREQMTIVGPDFRLARLESGRGFLGVPTEDVDEEQCGTLLGRQGLERCNEGEADARGPWNEGGDWQIVEISELKEGVENIETSQAENAYSGKKGRLAASEPKRRKSA